jgi:hypothetical protein
VKLRFLGQGDSFIQLERNHIYRARYLVQNPFSFAVACSSIPVSPIINALLNMPGTGPVFPADLQVFTNESGLPADWPASKKTLAGPECTVWAQMRATSDELLPNSTIEQALAPVNGRLVDFWDETADVDLIEEGTAVRPPVTPPTQTPPFVPPPATQPPVPSPATPPVVTTKPKKKASETVIPWAIVIAGASLVYRVLKG